MKIFLFAVLAALIGVPACNSTSQEKLPDFDLLLPDSTTVLHTRDIPSGQPVVIIHFESNCGECQKETESILKNMDSLKQVRFYFVTLETFDRLDVFNVHYKLASFPNIVAGQDFKHAMEQHYKPLTTPMLAIYNGQKQLRVVIGGSTSTSELIHTIHEIQ